MPHRYFSQRTGKNPNPKGLPLSDLVDLFRRVFDQMRSDGYFDEAFGFQCIDLGAVQGKVKDVELEMLLAIRKRDLWPISDRAVHYSEDDLFDVIEFLFRHVSKPVQGTMHSYGDCGMHWETFNRKDGRIAFVEKINSVLKHYCNPFELSTKGEVLVGSEEGFEQIFEADIPADDNNIRTRIESATRQFRKHASSLDDRRQAVRDLADVLEYLRPRMQELLTQKDERDLFNIANNFGVRHHNDQQKTSYDAALWLSWMFYFYLATIHVVLRKIANA